MLNSGDTPIVLYATDRSGWAFDNLARQLSRLLSLHFRSKISPFTRVADGEECDILAALWWQAALRVRGVCRAKKLLTCVYDHLSWCIDEGSKNEFRLAMKHTHVLGVSNRILLRELEGHFPGELPSQVFLLEDGVDEKLFRVSELPARFACGWAGNSSRHTPGGPEDHKGLNIIKEACRAASVDLHILDAAAGRPWPIAKMPEFYAGISAYICMSYTEGTPNPLLEAMSSGRPVISTRVGLAPDIIQHGVNGLLIDRTPEALTSAISYLKQLNPIDYLKMSQAARAAIVPKHTWQSKAEEWRRALHAATVVQSAVDLGDSIARPRSDGEPQPVQIVPAAPRTISDPPKYLLLSDVRDWAFHTNMMDLEQYLSNRFAFTHYFVIDFVQGVPPPHFPDYDGVFCVYHRWPINAFLPWDRTVGSLRALWFKPEKPLPPTNEDIELVNRFRGFHVVTRQNHEELKARCPNMVYLTNPVNMRRFPDVTPVEGEVIASWNGNAQHRNGQGVFVKGFFDIVQPAVRTAGVPLVYAEYNTKKLSPTEMPDFYMKGNVALCASLYEGASNSIMEAMACGQALITTASGNALELRDNQLKNFGETGIIVVERNQESFVEALNQLKKDPARIRQMGALNREEIMQRWSWAVWADDYAAFLRMAF